jgi:hypothetical protein
MLIKLCTKCCFERPTTEFGIRHRSLDGLQAWCRNCYREYQREYARNYRDANKHRQSQHRYRIKNQDKDAAHKAVHRALKTGELFMPLWCQRCHCVHEIEAHHHDYSKPLDVEWLCQTCHGLEHRTYRSEAHAGF